jgi:hypothetical protein
MMKHINNAFFRKARRLHLHFGQFPIDPGQLCFNFSQWLLVWTFIFELTGLHAAYPFVSVFVDIDSRSAASDMPTPSVIGSKRPYSLNFPTIAFKPRA